MTRVYYDKTVEVASFRSLRPTTCADIEYHRCQFVGRRYSAVRDPSRRSRIVRLKFFDCEQHGSALGPAIVETVMVEGFNTNGLFQTWGAVFKHVALRGRIGRIMVSPLVSPGWLTAGQQKLFDDANEAFYQTVDWALDIREAEFEEADLRGVPGRLIRRDAETQVLVIREKALMGTWRDLPLSSTYWPTALEFFLETGRADIVFVAPKRAKNFRALLEGLDLLRREGIAEPD